MSQLQWGLTIAGTALLVGMLLHTLWLTRRARPRQPEAPPTGLMTPWVHASQRWIMMPLKTPVLPCQCPRKSPPWMR